MASPAGQTQEQLTSRYGNIPAYNTQADLDYATSRTAPWSHAWGDERGLARIGDSIYQFDNHAGWNRVRTVPQGTFPAAGGGGGGGGSSSLLDALNNALNNQTTGGILSTTGSGTNYTPFGEYLLGPVYSGTSSTDPYVLQGRGQADTLPYVYPQVGGPGAFSVAKTYTGANDITSLLADALGINTTTSETSILNTDTDTDTETTTTTTTTDDDDERKYHPNFVVNSEYVGAEGNDGKYRDENNAIRAIHAAKRAKEAAEAKRLAEEKVAITAAEDSMNAQAVAAHNAQVQARQEAKRQELQKEMSGWLGRDNQDEARMAQIQAALDQFEDMQATGILGNVVEAGTNESTGLPEHQAGYASSRF